MKTPGLHKLAGACALLFGTLGPVVLPASLAHAYVAWQEGTTYAAGSKVTFNTRDYEALVSHTAYVGANWNPAATPTLWRDLGPTTGTPSPTPSPVPTGCTTQYTLWSASSGYGAGACVYVVLNANTSCPSQSNYRALQTVPAGTALGNSSYWKPEPSPAVCLPVTPRPTPFNPTPTPTPTPAQPVTPVTAAPEWSATQVYTGGLRVCYRGILYEARWWVHGDIPDPNNDWGPWRKIGVCPSGPRPSPIAATPTPTPVVTPTLYLPLPTPLPTPLPPISAAPIDWAFNSMGMTVADIAFTLKEVDTAFVPTYWALQGPGNRLYPLSDPVVQRAGQAGAYYYGGIAVASELQNSAPGGYRVLVCRDSQPDAPCYASDERGFVGKPVPTPTPPDYTPPPTPVPPQTLPAGPTRSIGWTLTSSTSSPGWGSVQWSADAQLLGLAPSSWHLERMETGSAAYSSYQLWVQDDILNNRSSYGGAATVYMPSGIYRLKVCNAGYAQCVASESQLGFFGVTPTPARVTVQPTPARTITMPCPQNPQLGTWTAGQQYAAGTVVYARSGSFQMVAGNGATSYLVGLFGVKQAHLSSAENEPYRNANGTVSYDPALWEVVGGMLPPCAPPSPTPPTPTQFIPTQTPTRLPVVSNAQPHATRTASVSGAAYRYQPARPPMAPSRG
ncbi:carbohydrate-binding protein [Chitinolyticbacter meiyuanensis]|uniref:carbohydrate-binding protein n=1 Tax=Chitinolyticbacter meiyuanensis TaxID=682798 RepID=UPI0011E596D3|nr:carbohydrate-binding protein [Chitinolyticbacter meiyuanensis]